MGRFVRLGLGSILATAAILAVSASVALAGQTTYGYGTYGPYATVDNGAAMPITGNQVTSTSNGHVCAGARDASYNFYGSYICATPTACHVYGGASYLYSLSHNSQNANNTQYGIYYGPQSVQGSNCPKGSYNAALASPTRYDEAGSSSATASRSCVTVPDPVDGYGVACDAAGKVDAHGLLALLEPESATSAASVVLVGAAPAGATLARVMSATGAAETLTPRNGLIHATIPQGGVTVQWKVPAGTTTSELG